MSENEIVVKEDSSPMTHASEFLKYGGKMEDLEKMLELQERHDANEARKAFHVAMADFKKNPPEILKSKKVSYKTSSGEASYNHADLGVITTAIGSSLAEHGLSASWKQEQDAGIKVTCRLTHELGHFEETSLFSPPDTSGGKNSIQAIGSTITYLQRYTLLALTGLAAHDQDDDGAGVNDDLVNEIASLKTVEAIEKYYRDHSKDHPQMKTLIALLVSRKAGIVKEKLEDAAAVKGV